MLVLEHLWIIPLLPLLGAAAIGIFGRTWPRAATNTVALGTSGLSFLAVAELVREFLHLDAAQTPWIHSYFTWIAAGSFSRGLCAAGGSTHITDAASGHRAWAG